MDYLNTIGFGKDGIDRRALANVMIEVDDLMALVYQNLGDLPVNLGVREIPAGNMFQGGGINAFRHYFASRFVDHVLRVGIRGSKGIGHKITLTGYDAQRDVFILYDNANPRAVLITTEVLAKFVYPEQPVYLYRRQ